MTQKEIAAIVEAELRRARRYWARQADAELNAVMATGCLDTAVELAHGLAAYLMTPMKGEK